MSILHHSDRKAASPLQNQKETNGNKYYTPSYRPFAIMMNPLVPPVIKHGWLENPLETDVQMGKSSNIIQLNLGVSRNAVKVPIRNPSWGWFTIDHYLSWARQLDHP